jgi:ABC-2 type transport system ATP-binding protein
MPTVVRTEHLTKDFYAGFWRPRPKRALNDLSFDVPAGGVFGLLGPNGAGKSTTLKLLTNLLRPTSGTASLLGRPAGDVAARARVGFLPEHPMFYDHLSAEELVAYLAGLFGHGRTESRQRAAAVLDRVGIGRDRRRPIRQYSKGMVQRVGLAQALVNDPELIILDEPMSGLDPIGRREVREMILELRDEGRTVLFSSHILSDAELLCSGVGILSSGTLVAAGSIGDLTSGETRGWEVVVSAAGPGLADRLAGRVSRVRRIADGRYSVELGPDRRPEPLVADLAASGAQLVSVSPVRTTLEDVFLQVLGQDPSRVASPSTATTTEADRPASNGEDTGR